LGPLFHYKSAGKTIEQAWDGVNLKFTFHRTVDTRLWNHQQEIVQIASGLTLNEDEDSMIWKITSYDIFSVQSLYATINDCGVRQVYTLVVWKLSIPPRLHIFLWLLANNNFFVKS
jgi:hypothetical protein